MVHSRKIEGLYVLLLLCKMGRVFSIHLGLIVTGETHRVMPNSRSCKSEGNDLASHRISSYRSNQLAGVVKYLHLN
ncbi:hypothetical protein L2E82_28225 [Cichorium intybus]|uniref:Uncharacterized protein n=1 Tax=Cichorium intybus TaxID=13427 RepID=A0ACB9CV07_CICIN|nr:hypothetical protein L2E82_28225 [Cichorium intybus]